MSTNDYTAYLAHYGIKGQKKGLRRFQSYRVAPTRSGREGREVGEAYEQSERVRLSQAAKQEADWYINASTKVLEAADARYAKSLKEKTYEKEKEDIRWDYNNGLNGLTMAAHYDKQYKEALNTRLSDLSKKYDISKRAPDTVLGVSYYDLLEKKKK